MQNNAEDDGAVSVPAENLLMTYIDDGETVDEHCPDFAVILVHEHKQVALVICGTRMIPAPNMKDVFMDLHAAADPFLNGQAHKGMAVGAQNVLKKSLECVVNALNENPGNHRVFS